ncbi:UDP-glucose 4-epimerase GalE [Mesomycoplasma lagogenitalium]|uniref:UDP-glucose 4-epimerase n=1 Tax=Mesomycoplasma lagogenitalium TaxID=171286 RepID=A0ABY8LTN5_9BACT|nr:UDP-glucose 4-epimerase GalE [Mesomycoplasma lagogenitalium]WGI36607.1 UDP-glucose 4-epimerase GalE [Mesomycoplasma lagogenitalium]
MKKETFLLLGGAGYIGNIFALKLIDENQNVIIVDNLSTGNKDFIHPNVKFYNLDHNNLNDLELVFKENKINTVALFSALIKVGESVQKPIEYYKNNLNGTINVLQLMDKYKVNKLIFSSSAAVYGQGEGQKINEDAIKIPINPYGKSKLMCEQIIQDYAKTNPLFKYGILRYFNVAGADRLLRSGLYSKTNQYSLLIPVISNAILNNEKIVIFGNDYKTSDKTCVRDYIHVSDLANAHYLLNYYLDNNPSDVFNAGANSVHSNLEIIKQFEKILNKKIDFQYGPRRAGDPDFLAANTKKIQEKLNFYPKYSLEDMIKDDLNWRKKINK